MENSYCSHSLNAIHFVDDNMSRDDRRRYLTHIEDCSICTRHIKSLRRDFAVVERLVPPISRGASSGEDYVEKIKSLMINFKSTRTSALINLVTSLLKK